MTLTTIGLSAGAGILGGAMNALAGGGTFATLPALIALGLPANTANATSNVALLPGAATSYRRASEQPDAPFFAARLHAGLLRRLGRRAEAHAWLTQLHPQLPASDESAGAALVLARIRELERELGVPAGQGYCQRAGRGFDPD